MNENEQIDRRDYGRLEEQVAQLTKDVHKITMDMEVMKELMQNAEGGWKMLLMVGGAAASAGVIISWALNHITIK